MHLHHNINADQALLTGLAPLVNAPILKMAAKSDTARSLRLDIDTSQQESVGKGEQLVINIVIKHPIYPHM